MIFTNKQILNILFQIVFYLFILFVSMVIIKILFLAVLRNFSVVFPRGIK